MLRSYRLDAVKGEERDGGFQQELHGVFAREDVESSVRHFRGFVDERAFQRVLIRRGIDLRAFCNRFFSFSISLNSFSFLSLSI